MFELFESRDGADEGGNVGGSMEQRWVLLDKEVGNFPASIGSGTKTRRRSILLSGTARGVFERNLVTHVVNEWRQECLGTMVHDEAKGLDVRTNALKRCQASRLSERAGSECDYDLFEEMRCRTNPKIMACKSQRGEVFLGQTG